MAKSVNLTPDAREVFRQALRFDLAEQNLIAVNSLRLRNLPPKRIENRGGVPMVIHHHDHKSPWPLLPATLVCGAFCVELGLKCLQRIEGKPILVTHNLVKLFKAISPKTRKRLQERYQYERKRPPFKDWPGVSAYLQVALRRNADLFERWRYMFGERITSGYNLACPKRTIMETILEFQPDWKSELEWMWPLPASRPQ